MNILFVCTGNTCRSPMAEALAKAALAKQGKAIPVSSAGTFGCPGQPASEHALTAMKNRGLDLSAHVSRQVSAEMLANSRIILAMSQSHKRQLLAINADCKDRLFTLHEFADGKCLDVADPFGQGSPVYELCAQELEALTQKAVEKLTNDNWKEDRHNMLAIGSDHRGYELKQEIKTHLIKKGIPFTDFGADSTDSADYPVFAKKVACSVTDGVCGRGILICGTGIGISIAANRIKGVRCALCHDVYSAKASRAHNDANILALGSRVIGAGLALEVLDAFLETPFSYDERHLKRIEQIEL